MLALLLSGLVFAAPCELPEAKRWEHYADEWGHDEKKAEKLVRRPIKIAAHEGEWTYLKRTCNKAGCDVSFYLKLSSACWKPLVSVQGKITSFKKGDWSAFRHQVPSSAINSEKRRIVVWRFDESEKTFKRQLVER